MEAKLKSATFSSYNFLDFTPIFHNKGSNLYPSCFISFYLIKELAILIKT